MTSISKPIVGPLGIGSLVAAFLLVGGIAEAQPGATPPGSVPPYSPAGPPPPPPPGPSPYYGPAYGTARPPMPPAASKKQSRQGWNIGLSLGMGTLESTAGDFGCADCESAPPTLGFDLHVGYMLMPRLALQGEVWGQVRPLDASGNSSMEQRMVMVAAQYWITPRFWFKGGLGIASLSLTYFDGADDVSEPLDDGGAFMVAVGYEVIRSGGFAFDVQLKTGSGFYDKRDEEVSTGLIALGVNWY